MYDENIKHNLHRKIRQDKLSDVGVDKLFINASFDNYCIDIPQQKEALDLCRQYTENFEENFQSMKSLILAGAVGTGKTHLATAVLRGLMEAGYWVKTIEAPHFIDEYFGTPFDKRKKFFEDLAFWDLLHVDEVGRTSATEAVQLAFSQLINSRYLQGKPTMITSNLNPDGLRKHLGQAASDRLRTNVASYWMEWPSYRGKISPAVMLTRADTGNVH